MKARTAVGAGVFIFGFLLCLGSVGTLDYMDACGEFVTHSDIMEAIVRAATGLICMAAALIIGGKLPLEDDNAEDTDTFPVSDEAECLNNLGRHFAESAKTSTESMAKLAENVRDLAVILTAGDEKTAQHKEEHHG